MYLGPLLEEKAGPVIFGPIEVEICLYVNESRTSLLFSSCDHLGAWREIQNEMLHQYVHTRVICQ